MSYIPSLIRSSYRIAGLFAAAGFEDISDHVLGDQLSFRRRVGPQIELIHLAQQGNRAADITLVFSRWTGDQIESKELRLWKCEPVDEREFLAVLQRFLVTAAHPRADESFQAVKHATSQTKR